MNFTDKQIEAMTQGTMLSFVVNFRQLANPNRKAKADVCHAMDVSASSIKNYLDDNGSLSPVHLDRLFSYTGDTLIIRWMLIHCPNLVRELKSIEANA